MSQSQSQHPHPIAQKASDKGGARKRRSEVAIDKVREVIAGVGVSAGLMSLWLAVVMHSASALLGGTVIGLVAAFAIAVVSHGR